MPRPIEDAATVNARGEPNGGLLGRQDRRPAHRRCRAAFACHHVRQADEGPSYAPLYEHWDRRPVMVTLTLPGEWEHLAPTPDAFRKLVDRFRRRLSYALGTEGRALPGLWKRETTRPPRSAPHLHALIALPMQIETEPVTQWISRCWYEVVDSGTEKHLRAGTGIDWAESVRMTDAMRLAVYFSKHSAKGGYQDAVPPPWVGHPIRFWGVWGLRPAEVPSELSPEQFVQAKRLLRAHFRATHQLVRFYTDRKVWISEPTDDDPDAGHVETRRGRVGARRVQRVDRRTGRVYYRWVYRRASSRSLRQSRAVGGFVLSPDGTGLASQVVRALTVMAPGAPSSLLEAHLRSWVPESSSHHR